MRMTPDVNVGIVDLAKGHEVVTENEDGSYTILINSRLSYDGQMSAYQHALEHIDRKDFEKDDVQQIERSAH